MECLDHRPFVNTMAYRYACFDPLSVFTSILTPETFPDFQNEKNANSIALGATNRSVDEVKNAFPFILASQTRISATTDSFDWIHQLVKSASSKQAGFPAPGVQAPHSSQSDETPTEAVGPVSILDKSVCTKL